MEQNKEELLKHLAASLEDAKKDGGAILLVGAGISVSAGIPPAQKLMKIAIENFPNYFTAEEQELAQEDLSQLQYNDIMTKLSNVKRKELFRWFIEGNEEKGIKKAKLNFAHIAIAELLKQRYFSRILTVNFDPLLINACYMVGMYPLPAIYDIGSVDKINAELLHDPCIIYLNGQHVGQVQRNTSNQLTSHDPILQQVVRSTGCTKSWIVAGYSGENDPLMDALKELRPYNNWLYWLEYNSALPDTNRHVFLETDEECKVIYNCDADDTFLEITTELGCNLNFIENPAERLQLYIDKIKFNTHPKLGNLYQEFIQDCKKLLDEINFSEKLNHHSNLLNLFDKITRLLSQEDHYSFRERVRPSQYQNMITERLDNLFILKEHLLEALQIKANHFFPLIQLSYCCLTIYRIQKENSAINESCSDNLQEAKNALDKLKTTDEHKKNMHNLVSRVLYNEACMENLKGNIDKSINLLKQSLEQNQKDTESYFTPRDIETDFDFKNLLMHPKFKELCKQYFNSVRK